MTKKALFALCLLAATPTGAAELRFEAAPAVKQAGGKALVTFTVSRATDVEVSVLDAKGRVVRHLAAGVLGAKTPPPAPLKPGLSQSLTWDGKDDYGETAGGGPFSMRVRAGMGVKLEKIVGGDPYAYYSREMGQGDHAAWRLTGLEAKPDGTVYVLGNANNYGPPALRAYSADGEYLRTVYPPPAGKPPKQMKGWGIYTHKDSTYSFQYNDFSSPALSRTLICGTRGRIARLIPSPENDRLLLLAGFTAMRIGTDGTLRTYKRFPFFGAQKVPDAKRLIGPFFTAASPDGKAVYVSGLYACRRKRSYSRILGAVPDGFWRDGQVWKVGTATRKTSVFFAMPKEKVITGMSGRGASPIADSTTVSYAAFHGVAVDKENNVFLCDRQNKRIAILNPKGEIIREIPLAYPDAIALSPEAKALYVTTRFGNYHRHGKLALLKFNDWTKDTKPSAVVPLCNVGTYPLRSYLVVAASKGRVFLWVGYVTLPVRIYHDAGAGLKLVKDFYTSGAKQRCLDVQHIAADPKTERVFIADGFKRAFLIRDWTAPRFEPCMTGEKKRLVALSIAVDSRNRFLFTHDYIRKKVKYSLWRYHLDGTYFAPAPVGDTGMNAISGQRVSNDWRIGLGLSQRGIAAAPDGSVAALGALGHTDYSGPLYLFKRSEKSVPWKPLLFTCFGSSPRSAGVRFDPQGNLYVGIMRGRRRGKEERFPCMGSIYKFAPTGSLAKGDLFPTAPDKPSKVYALDYGVIGPHFARTPRFGVDAYGRIYYPTTLLPRVTVIDNEGNEILHFGTYGNRDSMGGLEGDRVPTKDVPLAWPNSVDATEDYIYVSDIVNIRLLRLRKTFALTATCSVSVHR